LDILDSNGYMAMLSIITYYDFDALMRFYLYRGILMYAAQGFVCSKGS